MTDSGPATYEPAVAAAAKEQAGANDASMLLLLSARARRIGGRYVARSPRLGVTALI
jgi:hypothetical protein